MTDDDRSRSTWRRRAQLERLMWALIGVVAISAAALTAWAARSGPSDAGPFAVAAFGAIGATIGYLNLRIRFWPCPQCGKPFFVHRLWFADERRRRCAHCSAPGGRDET